MRAVPGCGGLLSPCWLFLSRRGTQATARATPPRQPPPQETCFHAQPIIMRQAQPGQEVTCEVAPRTWEPEVDVFMENWEVFVGEWIHQPHQCDLLFRFLKTAGSSYRVPGAIQELIKFCPGLGIDQASFCRRLNTRHRHSSISLNSSTTLQ